MDWLLANIDPSRAHVVDGWIAWHARIMVVAWGILAPLAVLVARYAKVVPWQDWPRELDNTLWWRSHWIGQSLVLVLTLVGVALVIGASNTWSLHRVLGYVILGFVLAQVAIGVFRGSKGGPTAPAPDGSPRGDHYDMTPWRIAFEWVHKSLGYGLLGLSAVTIVAGLWHANAPRWMWIIIGLWWLGLAAMAVVLQIKGFAVDTYQAIWGPSQEHPGNRRAAMGWGMRRYDNDRQPGE